MSEVFVDGTGNVFSLFTSFIDSNDRHRLDGPLDQTREVIVCLSHLRWDFVYQRPQHLLSRAAQSFRVYFVEEAVFAPVERASLEVTRTREGVIRVIPRLPDAIAPDAAAPIVRDLMQRLWQVERLGRPMLWA